ncbi:hypothetical protein E4U30_001475 [Claviceps sp. LM220 group G6]|nr:hypothetical protein E4U30_001475 [Claviceps sp. LM220 group G6]
MDHKVWIDAIQQNPTAGYLTEFRKFAEDKGVRHSDDLDKLIGDDPRLLFTILLVGLENHPAGKALRVSQASWLEKAIKTPLPSFQPLLSRAIDQVDDGDLWREVKKVVQLETEGTPPPPPNVTALLRKGVIGTPFKPNSGSFVNAKELVGDVRPTLMGELGPLHVDVPNLLDTFVPKSGDLKKKAARFFDVCCKLDQSPRYQDGVWKEWPTSAVEVSVVHWLQKLVRKLENFAKSSRPTGVDRRRLGGNSPKPTGGSTGKRSIDICVMSRADSKSGEKDKKYHFRQVYVAGELKCNPRADVPSIAWRDITKYARETFAAQSNRRFVLAFTICGTMMRVWVFDRVSGNASEKIDINKEPLRFIEIMLGFLWMNEEELGFDPTIKETNDEKYIEIKRNERPEVIVLKKEISRRPCIAGRATTCWLAFTKDDPNTPLVVKDSWQYPEREEEGDLLREAGEQGVVNVARYYHHETVQVRGMIDDVRNGVRQGLDMTTASKSRPRLPQPSSGATTKELPMRQKSIRTSQSTKRPLDQAGSTLPPSKRTCAKSTSISMTAAEPLNRVHRRVIVRDFGKPIYKASSRKALLACLEGCIEGHKSLYDKGILHRDISINNLMINEDPGNPSWKSFLIDLDLAINIGREKPSGAHGRTGTRVFMAIGLLQGDEHSFMHDLESFFWVLFWICVHYEGPGTAIEPIRYESWNYSLDAKLAERKLGVISDKNFMNPKTLGFTPYCQPLVAHVNKLRQAVFPGGNSRDRPFPGLYSKMMKVLDEAQKDPAVLAEYTMPRKSSKSARKKSLFKG